MAKSGKVLDPNQYRLRQGRIEQIKGPTFCNRYDLISVSRHLKEAPNTEIFERGQFTLKLTDLNAPDDQICGFGEVYSHNRQRKDYRKSLEQGGIAQTSLQMHHEVLGNYVCVHQEDCLVSSGVPELSQLWR